MNKQLKGSIALLTATFIWGTAFIAQSVGMELVGPFTFQGLRCLLAVLFLVPVTFLFDKKKGIGSQSVALWKEPRLWKSGVICGLSLFVAASLQQIGLVYSDAGKAGFITAMYIVTVPLLGVFVGMSPSRNALISVAVAVLGLYLLSCVGVSQINVGDIFLVGCAIAFAVQILCIDKLAGGLDGLRVNCIQALVVLTLSIPCAFLTENIDFSAIRACAVPIAYAGIMSMGIAYSLQIIGQQDVEPTTASLLMSLESVFAALAGWLLLHETMTPWELLGCALVFGAVIFSQLPTGKK